MQLPIMQLPIMRLPIMRLPIRRHPQLFLILHSSHMNAALRQIV